LSWHALRASDCTAFPDWPAQAGVDLGGFGDRDSGVGLGVAALIVVTAVMSGFQNELRDRILGSNAHIIVFDRADEPIGGYDTLLRAARGVEGVHEASPFIISKAMARVGMRSEGVVLKGIDPVHARGVLSLERDLVAGSLAKLEQPVGKLDSGEPVWGMLLASNWPSSSGPRSAHGWS